MKTNNKVAAESGKLKLELQRLLEYKKYQNSAMQKIILGLRETRDDNKQK